MSRPIFKFELNDRQAGKRYEIAQCWDNEGGPSLNLVTEEKADESAEYPSMAYAKAVAIACELNSEGKPRGYINIKVARDMKLALVPTGGGDSPF